MLPEFSGKRVLVTGASGFLGARVAHRLQHRVGALMLLGRTGSDFACQNLAVDASEWVRAETGEQIARAVHRFAPDLVIHCAGRVLTDHATTDLDDLIISNIGFHTALLEGLIQCDAEVGIGTARLVCVGTYLEHGPAGTEQPNSLYSATKLACKPITAFYESRMKIRQMTVKLPVLYGRSDHRPRLVNLLFDAAKSGRPLDLSPGEQTLNLLHVEDAVDALLVAGRTVLGSADIAEKYCFAYGNETLTLHGLVARIEEITGKPISVNWGARPYKYTEVMSPFIEGNRLPDWIATRDLSSLAE